MTRTRQAIAADDLTEWLDPLKGVAELSGVCVQDVGQGDAICVLDGAGQTVLRIDYGGVQSAPFRGLNGLARLAAINATMPVGQDAAIMLTHWDEDHWFSAAKGSHAATRGRWLVPRQWTSPAAVEQSTEIAQIRCIPPALEQGPICFVAENGDQLWWEKLKPFSRSRRQEDCNRTGVAFSVVKAATNQVIFLPGDAPFHLPTHYAGLWSTGLKMRGLVAFHHGAGTHWTKKTTAFLERWRDPVTEQIIVYSVGDPNRDGHPVTKTYEDAFPISGYPQTLYRQTAGQMRPGAAPVHILFV